MITPHTQSTAMPGHQVYTCLPTYVYVGGETAPSTVITVVHLSESEERVCVLYVKPLKGMLGIWRAFSHYGWPHDLGCISFTEGHDELLDD